MSYRVQARESKQNPWFWAACGLQQFERPNSKILYVYHICIFIHTHRRPAGRSSFRLLFFEWSKHLFLTLHLVLLSSTCYYWCPIVQLLDPVAQLFEFCFGRVESRLWARAQTWLASQVPMDTGVNIINCSGMRTQFQSVSELMNGKTWLGML